jgi:formylglycine-generating enzyme required for sulfatase activity
MSIQNSSNSAALVKAQLIDFLKNLPALASEDTRRAVAISAGFDSDLLSRLDYKGAPTTALPRLVDTIASYGELLDGRNALEAFLSIIRTTVGLDSKEYLDSLIDSWRTVPKDQTTSSSSLEGYLKYILDVWDRLESPLLPPEIKFSEIAIRLRVHDTGTSVGSSTTLRLPGYRRKDATSPYAQGLEMSELIEVIPDREHWLIVGDPGTGKTTLLLSEAARFAKRALNNNAGLVPVFISLANFSNQAEKQFGYSIFDHLDAIGKNLALTDLGQTIRTLALKGRVIFFLDGLDEISDSIRRSITDRIEAAIPSRLGNRLVYTSRKVGLSGPQGFALLELEPLTINEQRSLMITICGKEKTALLLKNIAGRRNLQDMASVPMALTVLALVARESGDNLEDYLYRNADLLQLGTQILLEGRHKGAMGVRNPERAEDVLARASFQLHNQLQENATGELFQLAEVERAVETAESSWLSSWQGSRDFIRDVSSHSNIFYPVDVLRRNYRYLHRTFREFLAALEMSKLSRIDRRALVAEFIDQQKWAEVLVMLGGLTADINDYLDQLLSGPPDLALRTLKEVKKLDPELAAQVLQLRSTRLQDRRQVFSELLRKLGSMETTVDVLRAYVESVASAIPRADLFFIQEILQPADTEIARELLADMFKYLPPVPPGLVDSVVLKDGTYDYWCDVPSGPFLFGAPEDDPGKPQWVPSATEVEISSFRIGRVPVTNLVYEVFDPSHKFRRDFQDQVRANELDEHPVVRVSWYEAVMFCQWLSVAYPGIRLPTEAEWEKAASWTSEGEKRRFPWGDEWDATLLNNWEQGPNRTTRVGMYPEGKSPCGALDMAGNVWEWCLDGFEEEVEDTIDRVRSFPRDPRAPATVERRIDRGGGWYQDVGQPHTFLRAADDPADTFSHCGFRLAWSDPAGTNHVTAASLINESYLASKRSHDAQS